MYFAPEFCLNQPVADTPPIFLKTPSFPALKTRSRFWSLRSLSRTACRHGKFVALFAGSNLLAVGMLRANTEEDVANTTAASGSGGNVSLTNAATGTVPPAFTDGNLPTATTDVTFPVSGSYVGVTNFSIGKAYTFGSLNDLNATPITIVNGNGATQAPLTLMGGDSVSGNTSDLIYVASAGFLTFSKANTQSIVLGANGNFDVGGILSVTAPISGNFGLTVIGGGIVSLGNANTFTGPLTINAGEVLFGAGATAGTIAGNIVINNNGTTTSGSLVFNSTVAQSIAGVISGTGTVTSQSSGTTTLSGANTYSGATSINNGALQYTTRTAMSANSAITVANNGILVVNAGGTNQFTNGTTGAGTIGGLFAGVGGQGNSITLSSGSAVGIDTTNATGGTLTYAGNIANAGVGLTKLGTGTLTLTGNNTYSGQTTVAMGILQAGSATAFGSGSGVFAANVAGVTLDLNSNSVTIGSLTGGGTAGGNVTLGTGTLTTGSDNTSTAYAGVISGTGGLIKVGTGTQTLSGFNSYTGGTTVNAGTLALGTGGGTGTVQGTVTVNSGATLSLTNQDALGYNTGTSVTTLRVNGGTVDEAVVPNAAAQVSGNQGYLTSFNLTGGTVSSTGGGVYNFNVAAGAAAPTITSNTSATTSLISGGILIRNAGTLAFTVAAGTAGTMSGSDLTVSGVISSSAAGGISKAGAGILTLTGTNTFTGATIVSAGTLATAGTGTLGAGNVMVSGTGALTLNSTVSFADTGTLSFAGTTRITLNNTAADTLASIVDTDNTALSLRPGTYNAAQLDAAFGQIATFSGMGSLTVTTAVPEPSTWVYGLLAAGGIFGLTLRRRAGA